MCGSSPPSLLHQTVKIAQVATFTGQITRTVDSSHLPIPRNEIPFSSKVAPGVSPSLHVLCGFCFIIYHHSSQALTPPAILPHQSNCVHYMHGRVTTAENIITCLLDDRYRFIASIPITNDQLLGVIHPISLQSYLCVIRFYVSITWRILALPRIKSAQ